MSDTAWLEMESASVDGKIGLSRNVYGSPISVHVCESCHLIFTVCPPTSDKQFGKSCMTPDCESYDVNRDVDLMFEIEPWRIQKTMGREMDPPEPSS